MGADAGKAADMLMHEHAGGATFRPFAADWGIVTAEDAYAVQRQYVRLLTQSHGTKAAGYKINTPPRACRRCAASAARWRASFSWIACTPQARAWTLSAYGRVGLEFEIAVRLNRDLVPAGRRFLPSPTWPRPWDGVCPAIEIIDDRGADYRQLDAFSLIADNAWNGGIVLGDFTPSFPTSPRSRPSCLLTAKSLIAVSGVTCSVIRFIR